MPVQEVTADDARALQRIADAIAKSHKVLVVTGAGISTNCGIPDFRSKDGLYNIIPQSLLPTPPSSIPSTPSRKRKASALDGDDYDAPTSQRTPSSGHSRRSSSSPASRMKGQDLFHARVFQNPETTEVFYQFIAGLRQKIQHEVIETSATHKFIRILRDAGRLMRCYTQNIDGLEHREGLCMDLARGQGNKRRFMKKNYEAPRPDEIQGTDLDGGCEVVQLHGELTKLRCTMCSSEEIWTDQATETLLEGYAPKCEVCVSKSEIRKATGKRGLTVGALRPNIVLYGEEHPQNTLLSPFVPYDIASSPEILIIMGTSLKVHGLQRIIRDFAKAVHSRKNGRVIFVNNTKPAESVWDGTIDDFVSMDCDAWVKDLRVRREELWMRQGEIVLRKTKAKVPSGKQNVTDGEKGDRILLSKRVRREPNLTVDVPKWDHVNHRPMPASPKARATPWKQSRRTAESVVDTLLPVEQERQSHCTTTRVLSESTNTALDTEITTAKSSPLKPHYSPISPSYSTMSLSPRSKHQSIINTPSRLRFATGVDDDITEMDKENSDEPDEDDANEALAEEQGAKKQNAEDDATVLTQGRRSFTQRLCNAVDDDRPVKRVRLNRLSNKSLLERLVASIK